MVKLECRICKKEKETSEFNKDSYKKNGYTTFCKVCKKEIDSVSYQKRKESIRIKKLKQIGLLREEYIKLKSYMSCAKCGEDRHYMLDFHHKNKDEKEYTISGMIWQSLSLDKVKGEIAKCVTLCSNHHREFHHLEKEIGVKIDGYLK